MGGEISKTGDSFLGVYGEFWLDRAQSATIILGRIWAFYVAQKHGGRQSFETLMGKRVFAQLVLFYLDFISWDVL